MKAPAVGKAVCLVRSAGPAAAAREAVRGRAGREGAAGVCVGRELWARPCCGRRGGVVRVGDVVRVVGGGVVQAGAHRLYLLVQPVASDAVG